MEAVIERGMANGAQLVFERASEQSPETIPGDVLLIIKTESHKRFKRKGNDLHHTMHISLKEALLGFNKKLLQLDGRELSIKRSGVTHPDYVMKVTAEGMPHHNFPSDKGDLYVKFIVKFPKKLTADQKTNFESFL